MRVLLEFLRREGFVAWDSPRAFVHEPRGTLTW